MKTKWISMLLACIMLVSLTACTNDKPGETPEESTKETDVQTTEDVTTEDETTESTAELALNEDLLSDVGLTYPEIVEKRGERNISELITVSVAIGYFFQNGYGAYIWGLYDLDFGRELDEREGAPVPRDENHNIIAEEVQLPKSDIPCTCITHIKAEDFLLNTSFPLNVSDIERIEGVKDVHTGEDGIATSYKYGTDFVYKDYIIYIFHNDAEIIDADSMTEVFINLSY